MPPDAMPPDAEPEGDVPVDDVPVGDVPADGAVEAPASLWAEPADGAAVPLPEQADNEAASPVPRAVSRVRRVGRLMLTPSP